MGSDLSSDLLLLVCLQNLVAAAWLDRRPLTHHDGRWIIEKTAWLVDLFLLFGSIKAVRGQ